MRLLMTVGLAAGLLGMVGEANACPADRAMGGVVQRVSGQRGEVFIQRAGAEDFRPAPMEALCEGDVVVASASGASVTMRLEGASSSTTVKGPGRYELPRAGRRPNIVDNALQQLLETWMPDIRRSSNFGVVRGGSSDMTEWATPGLKEGVATIRRGERPLFVRWSGGAARYRVEVAKADGSVVQRVNVVNATEARVPAARWSGGPYTVRVYPNRSRTPVLQGIFTAGDPPPANPTPFPATGGEEVRAASEALRIARIDPPRWGFEAMQMIDSAPAQGLDREAVYRSIDGLNEDTVAQR